MTLDTSGPAAAVVAAARPSDGVGRPSETLHERPDLGALEALLTDPAVVSSEEPAPAGLFAEFPAQDETAADGDAPLESRLDDFATDSAPALPIHIPDAETPAVPMGHGTRGAEPATRDETALANAGEGDSSRADAGSRRFAGRKRSRRHRRTGPECRRRKCRGHKYHGLALYC